MLNPNKSISSFRPPLRLMYQDLVVIEKMMSELDDSEDPESRLDAEELKVRSKVRKIIEKMVASWKRRTETAEPVQQHVSN